MSLNKTPLNINFSQGLNLKTDSKQVTLGQFLSLENSIFDKGGLLQKRNGFAPLTALPDSSYSYLTTLNDGLVAIGTALSSYSQSTNQWIKKGSLQLLNLSTLPLLRTSSNQIYGNMTIAPNGSVCTVSVVNTSSGEFIGYTIADSQTGQSIVPYTILTAAEGVSPIARVYIMGPWFIIVYQIVSGGETQLVYSAIPYNNPATIYNTGTIVTSFTNTTSGLVAWDAVVGPNGLYVAYYTTLGGDSLSVSILSQTLSGVSGPIVITTTTTAMPIVNIVYDQNSSNFEYFYVSAVIPTGVGGGTVQGFVISSAGNIVPGTTFFQINLESYTGAGAYCANLTAVVVNGMWQGFAEMSIPYTWGPADSFIVTGTYTYPSDVQTGPIVLMRSVGLASNAVIMQTVKLITGGNETLSVPAAVTLIVQGKATFLYNTTYILTAYGSSLQPTYFLISGSAEIVARFAYQNGGGYQINGLPNTSITNSTIQIPYLYKDLIASQAKPTPATPSVQTSSVYSQTGVNLVSIDLAPTTISSASIGGTLNISGGFLWSYDGVTVAEQGFHLYPDNINVTTFGSVGSITADTYYYQVTYEWTDNNGNVNRSAPSVPVSITTTGSMSTNTINIPTLRLTQKTDISIIVYRWSTAQQVYYAISSPSTPQVINNPDIDFQPIVDTASDASILGNPILYTTGGVIENIAGPACNIVTLFNNRLFLVDAEDPNLLWYSKQVIEAVPVEMSDLLTQYVAPTTGAQGSTGPMTAAAPMDDKLILYKPDAVYYVNGIGPDNTGSNSQYSDATFISSSVGCSNQNSIVFIPNGLMFQSDKGIWLLGRDLSTSYIGAQVETLTQTALVNSALQIPATNQVRFTMNSGITLMYDFFFHQWGTFVNIPGISSTLYTSLHTYINKYGALYQETPDAYLDNSNPVLMQFTTGWANLAGLQGYERFYQMLLLGEYITPFKLNLSIAYNYQYNNAQTIVITPNNFNPTWGSDALWGTSTPWGGPSQIFEARVFPQLQKCESFQISIQEQYDSNLGVTAGAGLSLSGVNLIVGAKKGYRVQSAGRSFG